MGMVNKRLVLNLHVMVLVSMFIRITIQMNGWIDELVYLESIQDKIRSRSRSRSKS